MALAAASRRLLVNRIQPALLAALQPSAWLHGSPEQLGSPTAQLHYDEVQVGGSGGDATPPMTAVVLHGLLGSGRNLRGMTADLCRQAAEQTGDAWRALLVDLRNHGRSTRAAVLPPPHDLHCTARDVVRLMAAALGGRPPEALIAHSLGGKTALEVVRQLALPGAPLGQPRHVWVLDARPTAMHPPLDAATREVLHVLDTVRSIPLPLPSREALYSLLRERGFSTGMQQWLGSNLVAEGAGRYGWAFNLDGAAAMFDDYLKQDYSALLRAPPPGVTLHVLRALRSDRWDHDTLALLRGAAAATAQPAVERGSTRYHELPDAGHWVHADNPKGLVQLMLPSLVEAARQ